MTQTLKHIAIIMDGNGRWAKQRGLPRTAGHARGAESVRRACEAAIKHNIPYLTLFGFSSENWSRPEEEVQELMGLLKRYLQSETAQLHQNGIRLRFIGDRRRLAQDIIQMMEQAEELTRANTSLNLTVALNYGGRQEILRAVSRILFQSFQAMALDKMDNAPKPHSAAPVVPWDLDDASFAQYLDTAELPDPDLIVRTSGEKRISNFLLWQAAYAEFEFMDVLWPDFSEEHLVAAIENYHGRDRRFGKVRHG